MKTLEEVKQVLADRQEVHGDALATFEEIAARWSNVLQAEVSSNQVARCMMELKMVRMNHDVTHRDNIIDIIGYATILDSLLNDVNYSNDAEKSDEE